MTSGRTDWVWTDELTSRLEVLWAEGFSASEIAMRLGSITRSGVLGKVNRMGLPRRREPRAMRKQYKDTRRKPTKPRKSRAGQSKLSTYLLSNKPPEIKPEPVKFTAGVWSPLPGSSPVPLMELTGCKWPVSDPFAPKGSIDLFCNCAKVEGKPYCREHVARAVGQGTASERAAVKVAGSLSRGEWRQGEMAREAA